MGILPTNLDYTTKDRASLERRLDSLIASVFPNWSETQLANFGNILRGLPPFVTDFILYYMDAWARESRIGSATLRRSLLALVKLIDYAPAGASAATVDIVIDLVAAMGADLTLPAGTKIRTRGRANQVDFQLLSDITFLAGVTTSGSVSVEHTESFTEVITSNGLPNQTFKLPAYPFVPQSGTSPTVVFGDGTYTQVDNFLDSSATDKHFVLALDDDERATLYFGNGTNGKIPIGSGQVDYKTGGGTEGNVDPGDLQAVVGTQRDDAGSIASFTVTQALAATGGGPRESNAQIRLSAPKAARVINRAIAREDFEIVAESVSGVSRALCVTSNETAAVGENQGYLFVIPTGGGTASSALLDTVKGKFLVVSGQPDPTHPTINTFDLQVQTAAYYEIDHQIRAHRAAGVTAAQMKSAIETVLADFYGDTIAASRLIEIAPNAAVAIGVTTADGDSLVVNPLVNFGYYYKDADGNPASELAWSDVFNVLRDLPEVRKLDATDGLYLNTLREDVPIGVYKFPVLGSVTVIDGDTGNTL
jgi:hypothetical protein